MHEELKKISCDIFEDEHTLKVLNKNVTYIFKFGLFMHNKVYKFQEWASSIKNVRYIYNLGLRYDPRVNGPALWTEFNSMNDLQGLVLNMTEKSAEKFEKELIFPMLKEEFSNITFIKVDNNQIKRDNQMQRNILFNTLFTEE